MKTFLLLPLILSSCLLSAQWTQVYENDSEGKRISGDKIALIAAVHSGKAIRLGWTFVGKKPDTNVFEHFAEPDLVTIRNGTEVFAQTRFMRKHVNNKKRDAIKYSWDPISYLFSTTDSQLSNKMDSRLDGGDKIKNSFRLRWFVQ